MQMREEEEDVGGGIVVVLNAKETHQFLKEEGRRRKIVKNIHRGRKLRNEHDNHIIIMFNAM